MVVPSIDIFTDGVPSVGVCVGAGGAGVAVAGVGVGVAAGVAVAIDVGVAVGVAVGSAVAAEAFATVTLIAEIESIEVPSATSCARMVPAATLVSSW